MKQFLFSITAAFILAGCAKIVVHQPATTMNTEVATASLIDLTKKNKESINISEDYIELNQSKRYFFKSISSVAIYKRNVYSNKLGKVEYRVYIDGSDTSGYVYKTLIQEEAEQYIDALESLINAYKSKHGDQTPVPSVTNKSISDKLEELTSLKNKGLITESEFQQKRKQLLENL